MAEPHAPMATPPAESRRWWVWVPAMGLIVQVVRVWRAFDAPASHLAPRERRD